MSGPSGPSAAYGYSREQYSRFRKYGILYLVLFSVMYMTLYCCRLNLTAALPVMVEELNWSKGKAGILTGVLFWTYGLGQLVNGRLADVFGPVRFLILAVILSIAANLLMGLMHSLPLMAVIWGLNGYFQSMAWGPGIASITVWWPGKSRGFATGFAYAFSGFGQAVVALSVAVSFQILPQQGWRAAFFLPPVLPAAALILFWTMAKKNPAQAGLPEYVETDPVRAENEKKTKALLKEKGILYPYRYLLSNKVYLAWLVIAFLTGLARYGLVTWIPLYFTDRFGINITEGLLQSLALPVGMGIGTLVVPALTDRFCPNNRLPAVIFAALIGAAAIGAFFFLTPLVTVQLVAIEILLFVAGFCIYAINGTAWAYAADIGGRAFSGTGSGILNFACYMWAAFQSFLYGNIQESLGWGVVFLTIAVFCAVIAVLGYCNRGKAQQKPLGK